MGSSEYYDNYIAYQIKSGINDRIYHLYRRVCRLGLSSDTHILEIGCGIGTLTYLLSRKIKKGKIEAIDISPMSIEFAKQKLKRKNISFTASGILDFKLQNTVFDKILLFDVLEHIPEADYPQMFEKIGGWMGDDSLLLINFPNPDYILFDRKNDPEALQETDNPVYLNKLSDILDDASLGIDYFETHSVWVKNDYQFLIVRKKSAFIKQALNQHRNVITKFFLRLKRELRKFMYKYPGG